MIQSVDRKKNGLLVWLLLACILGVLCIAPQSSYAICATVKIEIQQELTLERQGFDAHMRINNTLSNIPIENVAVTVNFSDEAGNTVLASSDPNDTNAAFYIRVDTMDNIDNVQGSGSVAPSTSADIHWLIIPAPGASNGLESGTLYYVGATLTYTLSGQNETVDVSPDYIFVKPMPQLVLDYFLPTDVYGDDAHTDTVEPPVPFYLGLRVSNKGHGYARQLKIESAQPQIVENDLGLLIGFQIDGSTVNGQPATDSLLVDLGDIAPNSAGTARWVMSCTLSGQFIDFNAEFSHADELGGKMTSLIAEDDVNTHFLVHDVRVDAQGRDNIEDFLAKDDDVYRVYESDNTTADVTDQSPDTALGAAQGLVHTLATPPTAGFMYAQVTDPYSGSMLIEEAVRSDGKYIKSQNIWLSKTRAGSGPWQYFVNIFDHNTTGSYTITFQSQDAVPQPPFIMYIPERSRIEGQQLSFLVEASDPNGTIPALSAERLPIGASFTDQGDGRGIFDWTPTTGQAGTYFIRFIASDGVLESARQAVIRILSADDTDGDGMQDSWEMDHFAGLERDGSADFDGDGLSDLDEYLNGFDPTVGQSVPSLPEIVSPQDNSHVAQLSPTLEILNSIDPESDPFTYQFEIFHGDALDIPVASQIDVTPQTDSTTWTVPVTLNDNTHYHWRVKAQDATGSSDWVWGRFFVNTQNDTPSAPGISYPADGTSVDTTAPTLEITNSTDIDGDDVTYTIEIYSDSAMTTLVATASDIAPGGQGHTAWQVETPLNDGTTYYWQAIAADGNGAQTASAAASFQVDTVNRAPAAPVINQPADGVEVQTTIVDLIVDHATDPDGDSLNDIFEIDTTPTFDSADKLVSPPLSAGSDTTAWAVDGLAENTRYYWRAKADDGAAQSPWTVGTFFVNADNQAADAPIIKNPGFGAWVNTLTPQPTVHPVTDPDEDQLFYQFEIYSDADLNAAVGYTETQDPTWIDITELQAARWYYWRVRAVDEHGIGSEWSETGSFFVKLNGMNLAPQLTFIQPVEDITTNGQGINLRWSDSDPDSSAVIAFYYDTDNSGADGILIADNISEDADGTEDYYAWDISALEGTYYIYAVIADAVSTQTVYAPAAITIDRTPPTVSADPSGGTHSQSLNVTLTADEPARIYYTLDASEPGFSSTLYAAPIPVDQDTTLKFMAIDAVGNPSATVTEDYTFAAADIAVYLSTDKGRTLDGIRVYAFTDAGAYTGKSATSDGSGEAHFDPDDFSAGDYQFRVDYLGHQFWSDAVALPDTRSIEVVIAEEPVTITVDTAAGAAAGVRIYLFNSSGSYLGQYLDTDDNGQVIFDLPVGVAFTFRADLYGNQYWSNVTTVQAGSGNAVPVNAGGGRLGIDVVKAADAPIAGTRVYLFNTAGSYLGHYANTDDSGRVGFDVPEGDYKVRADYLGYQFWSADTAVTTDTRIAVTIPHQQIQVTVESLFQSVGDSIENVRVYLFSAAGSYLGQYVETDDQGRAYFDLPQKAYKFRADYMGQQFWSEEVTWQDPVVSVPMADARVTVTGAGLALENVRVYLFTAAGSFLGQYADTDADGRVLFHVPEGAYKFRADYQGSQFWSTEESLAADQLHDVGISTGGGSFAFTLWGGADEPLGNIQCYVFDESGGYLGLYGTTDASGQVTFDLADGVYKIRADYLGHQFWSDVVQVPDILAAKLTVDHTRVDVNVLSAGQAARNVRVYLFRDDGAYQGRYLETDVDGKVAFDLPAGVDFMFRADLCGHQYWSDATTIPAAGPAQVTIDAGGGRLQLTVEDGAGNAMPDLKVYLFSPTPSYLGRYRTTDAAGLAAFDLPAGTFKLRVDYLGYSFWTDDTLVEQDTAVTLPIVHQDVDITVQGRFQGADDPLTGVKVYLFTPTGSYLGRYQETDADGRAGFSLPQQEYMVRADYMGMQFWSATFNSSPTAVTIPMADAQVTVTGAGLPREAIKVYLFSDTDTYLGQYAATDTGGMVRFRLPAGNYKFRADYQSNPYWSATEPLTADQTNAVVVSVGGGTFTLNVTRDPTTPLAGVRAYVFNDSGAYIGLYGSTDDQGRLFFDLADGNVQFRVDYLGYPFWSPTVTVPSTLTADVEIPHQDVTVTLTGHYLGGSDPLADVKLYLFSSADSYMGLSRTTDTNGQALFSLPDRQYKVRADYLGNQYWSALFQSQDMSLEILQGAVDLHVHRSGTDAEGVRTYLFNASGSYLGRYNVTDVNGWTAFILPEGIYRFRVDADGIQHWSPDVTVAADQTGSVEVDLDQ